MCNDAVNALIERIRRSVIGDDVVLDGPFGPRRLIYADYAASGRALSFIEDYIREHVLPLYANTHTWSVGELCSSIRSLPRGERGERRSCACCSSASRPVESHPGACLRGSDWDPCGGSFRRRGGAWESREPDPYGDPYQYRRQTRLAVLPSSRTPVWVCKRKGAEDAGSRSDATTRPRRSFTARPRRQVQSWGLGHIGPPSRRRGRSFLGADLYVARPARDGGPRRARPTSWGRPPACWGRQRRDSRGDLTERRRASDALVDGVWSL